MNSETISFESLSAQQQRTFRNALRNPSNTASINESLFSGVRYIVDNSTTTLYQIDVTTQTTRTTLDIAPITGADAISVLAVPTTEFSNSSPFYAPESKRQIAVRTIEDSKYRSPVVLYANQTAVSYDGEYYILNSSLS